MKRSDFYYHLPEELIAQTPLVDRAASRLLVLDKTTGQMTHKQFKDILDYFDAGDCLVLNNTKVLPVRLFGQRASSGAKVEILLLKRCGNDQWEVLVHPGKKAKVGDVLIFGNGLLKGTIMDIVAEGNRIIQFEYEGIWEELLLQLGEMPLPPYIHEKLQDQQRYQTVYAKTEGSAAAPTAGLHFTTELLAQLETKGVIIANVTLHVGLGTFRPVKVDNILEHPMHKEVYVLEAAQAKRINAAKQQGHKVIAVGTTSCRTLETCADDTGMVQPGSGETGIFIYPGYQFKIVDGLITNFHLPESTLMMLISALAGREHVLQAYATAVEMQYRFFSFGDAMLIR